MGFLAVDNKDATGCGNVASPVAATVGFLALTMIDADSSLTATLDATVGFLAVTATVPTGIGNSAVILADAVGFLAVTVMSASG